VNCVNDTYNFSIRKVAIATAAVTTSAGVARKSIAMALMILLASSAGYTEPVGTATPSHPKDLPVSSKASYFQGVWNGRWEGQRGELTVTIGAKDTDGTHETGFSSGIGTAGDGTHIWPFSLTARGREDGGVYKFEYKGAYGFKREVTLKKYKDDMVKIRLEWLGPNTNPRRPAYWETYLNRN
jgi:hypothetical protein